jgi:hypothetical protein
MRRTPAVLITVALALCPSVASADVIWPALIFVGHLLSVPAIGIGLAVEILCLRRLLKMSWRTSLLAGVAMNLVSCALGVVLIPLVGIVWEVFPGLILYYGFNIGTFNPGTWAATFLLAAVVNALVEAITLRFLFGIAFSRRVLIILALANCASVAVACFTLWLEPPPEL